MRHIIISCFLLNLGLLGCAPSAAPENNADSTEEAVVNDHVYHSDDIGWTMGIPEGWTVMKRSDLNAKMEKGKEALEEVVGEGFDYSTMQFLINFQKDEFNMFQSTLEPYDEAIRGDWEVNNDQLKGVVYDAYTNQGIVLDTSKTTEEIIGGLSFKRFDIVLYDPSGKVILNQIMYTQFINGNEVAVNINYNNLGFREEMLNAWKASTFDVN